MPIEVKLDDVSFTYTDIANFAGADRSESSQYWAPVTFPNNAQVVAYIKAMSRIGDSKGGQGRDVSCL